MQDPRVILHKKSTQFVTKIRIWDFPGVVGFTKILRSKSIKKPYYKIASIVQKNMERYEIEIFKDLLKKDMTVVDIGANVGVYSQIASKIVGKNGRVFAFEPEYENLKILKENLKEDEFSNVKIVPKVLSEKSKKVRLFLDAVNIGNHSLSKQNLLKGSEHIDVQSTTLDKYFKNKGKVDFIKMDVQGSEGKIIQGAKYIIKKHKPIVMIEFWPQGLLNCGSNPLRLLTQLTHFGFKIQLIDKANRKLLNISPDQIVGICYEKKFDADYTNLVLST